MFHLWQKNKKIYYSYVSEMLIYFAFLFILSRHLNKTHLILLMGYYSKGDTDEQQQQRLTHFKFISSLKTGEGVWVLTSENKAGNPVAVVEV